MFRRVLALTLVILGLTSGSESIVVFAQSQGSISAPIRFQAADSLILNIGSGEKAGVLFGDAKVQMQSSSLDAFRIDILFDVDELPTHGGSLRIYARHTEDDSRSVSENTSDCQKRKIGKMLMVYRVKLIVFHQP